MDSLLDKNELDLCLELVSCCIEKVDKFRGLLHKCSAVDVIWIFQLMYLYNLIEGKD